MITGGHFPAKNDANSKLRWTRLDGSPRADCRITFLEALVVSGGKLRRNVNSGLPNVGSGVTVDISASAIFELAGSVSDLVTVTPGQAANVITHGTGCLLVTGPTRSWVPSAAMRAAVQPRFTLDRA